MNDYKAKNIYLILIDILLSIDCQDSLEINYYIFNEFFKENLYHLWIKNNCFLLIKIEPYNPLEQVDHRWSS